MGEVLTAVVHAGEDWFRTRETKKEQRWQRRVSTALYPLPEQELLSQYAEAFTNLARLFETLPCQKERPGDEALSKVVVQVRQDICARCKNEEQCWEADYFSCCQAWYELWLILQGEKEEPLEEILGFCRKQEQVLRAVTSAYGQARQQLLMDNRLMEQRMAAGEQIRQTAELLKRAAKGLTGDPVLEQRLWRRLPAELKYLGLRLCGLRVFRSGQDRPEIYLSLQTVRDTRVSVKSIAELLSECCHQKLRPAWNCPAVIGHVSGNFHFVAETRYQMLCGISKVTKAGELVSGDSYSLLQKDTGTIVMSLADGMGSGLGACQESEKVIGLLEQFLEAGFPQETAVRMIHSCMLLQNTQERYSTIDLCMVDLYEGDCDFLKSGAAPTFLKYGEEIEVLQPAAMPPGIQQQPDYARTHRKLAAGDVIIMMTDGVLEALPEEDRDRRMEEMLRCCATVNAKEYAQRLMERVYLLQKLRARDDMTILVGSLWEK